MQADDPRLEYARSHLGFFDTLAEADRRALERGMMAKPFRKGEVLRSKDSECLGLLLVLSGEIRAYIQSMDGREVTLYRLGPGELCVLSASCILNSIDFDVSISAERETEVLRLPLGPFEEIMKRNVWVENFALRSAMDHFSDVIWAIEQLVFMRFDKRLAIYLLDESRDSGGEIRSSHEEIAKHMGSAREVVSRMLKNFASQGIVEQGRGSLRVLDRERLKAFL
jgi:CRP/FNR family transcriptional regulator